jgi:hypothetical protein
VADKEIGWDEYLADVQEPLVEDVLQEIQAVIATLEDSELSRRTPTAVSALIASIECLQVAAERVLYDPPEPDEPPYKQAMNGLRQKDWRLGMPEEYQSLVGCNT